MLPQFTFTKFVADADGLRRAKSLDLRPLRLFFVPNVLHMTKVAWEDSLQDAELGLIDPLSLIAIQDFPQIALLAVIYLTSPVALLFKDAINIANLLLQLIKLFFVVIRGRLIRTAVYDIMPLALKQQVFVFGERKVD